MRDLKTQKVIDEFFREEKQAKKLEHLRFEKNKNSKRSNQKNPMRRKQKEKKGKMSHY